MPTHQEKLEKPVEQPLQHGLPSERPLHHGLPSEPFLGKTGGRCISYFNVL
jgi:hypothetical protein